MARGKPIDNDQVLTCTFRYNPEFAEARGRPLPDGRFLVLAGSTALRSSGASAKRDRAERDRLVRLGVLAPHPDADLYVFTRDHQCSSASQAAGIVRDGNASGPQLWKDPSTGKSLKDLLANTP